MLHPTSRYLVAFAWFEIAIGYHHGEQQLCWVSNSSPYVYIIPGTPFRGDNPAAAASEASVESGAEAKSKSMRNPIDLARSKTLRHQERHGQGEVRRELGVIVYNFDKKEQVLRFFMSAAPQRHVGIAMADLPLIRRT